MEAELNNLKEVRNKVLPLIVDELPASSPFFVGRATELVTIAENFSANKKVLIVQGIGGSGKSQLAAEYAHHSKISDKPYRLVRWLKADSKENLKDGYLRLGDELGVKREEYKESEVNLKKAIDYQLSRYENVLLIYDNVESLDYVEDYLPKVGSSNADILLTTRNRFADYLTIEIGEFNSVEIQSYLNKRLKKEVSLDISEQLGKELGYLPLAVVQSGSYMVKHAKTPEAFLKLLQGDGRQNIIEQGVDSKIKAVANLWDVTLDRLSEQSLELLRLCAYLNPDNVPRALLEQMTPENLRDAVLFELRFQSLLVDTGNGEVFRIHRLLQEAIRKQFANQDTDGDKLKTLIEKAVEALKVVIGSHELTTDAELLLFWKQNTHLNIQINSLMATGERLKIKADLLADLYEWAGEFQHYINLSFIEGLRLHQQALGIRENIYKDNHPDIANSLFNISNLYVNQAKFVQAMEYAEKALTMRKSVYGDKHASVANSFDLLGYLIFNKQGRSGNLEAIKYLEEALSIRKIVYGQKDPAVATSLCNIGDVILPKIGYGGGNLIQGRYLEQCLKALKYYEEALVIRQEIYGNKHLEVASSLVYVGSVYGSQPVAHFKLALKHYEEALKIKKAIYGDKHPEIAKLFLLIGRSYQHRGVYRIRTIGYYKDAVAILEAVYGNRHPAVASAYLDLTAGYRIALQYRSAYKYSKKALEIYESMYDAQHPEVIRARYELNLVIVMLGFAPIVAPIIQPIAGASIRRTFKLNSIRADEKLSPQEKEGLYFSNNAKMLGSVVSSSEINEREVQAQDNKGKARRSECVLS